MNILLRALHWQPQVTVLAATVLAIESLVFIGAYGRIVLQPIV